MSNLGRNAILQKIVSEVKKYYVMGLSNSVMIAPDGKQLTCEVTHQGEEGLRKWVGTQCGLLSEEVIKALEAENKELTDKIKDLEAQLKNAKSKAAKNS